MMDQEIARKRSAEIVRPVAQTAIMRPVGSHLIRKKSEKAVLRELRRLQRKGYVFSASELARFHRRAGGGFGVKITLAKPLPQPMPAWAKGCALVGTVLSGLAIVVVLVLNALAAVFTAAAALPWGMIIGGMVIVAALLAGTKPGRACCRVIVEVWH